jgi:hypothetical protein
LELQVCVTRLHMLIVKMAVESNSEVRGTTGQDKCLISARPERAVSVRINVTFRITVVAVETE